MALFDHTAARLARGPAVLFAVVFILIGAANVILWAVHLLG